MRRLGISSYAYTYTRTPGHCLFSLALGKRGKRAAVGDCMSGGGVSGGLFCNSAGGIPWGDLAVGGQRQQGGRMGQGRPWGTCPRLPQLGHHERPWRGCGKRGSAQAEVIHREAWAGLGA